MSSSEQLTNIPLKPLRPSEKRRRKLKLPKSKIEPPTLKVSEPPKDVEVNEATKLQSNQYLLPVPFSRNDQVRTVSYTLKSVKKQGLPIIGVAVVDVVVVVVVVVIVRTAVEELSITDA